MQDRTRPPDAEPLPGRPVIVHDLAHALAAMEAASMLGVAVTLRSAPGAADHLGSGAFRAIVDRACEQWPDVSVTAVLDCADAAGHALGALRIGIRVIRFHGHRSVRRKLADIAAQTGARLDRDRRRALDLLDCPDPLAACRAWLSRRRVTQPGPAQPAAIGRPR